MSSSSFHDSVKQEDTSVSKVAVANALPTAGLTATSTRSGHQLMRYDKGVMQADRASASQKKEHKP
jgi:hypothetical protein